MNTTIGFTKNAHQVTVLELDPNSDQIETKILALDEIEEIDALYYAQEHIDETNRPTLDALKKMIPTGNLDPKRTELFCSGEYAPILDRIKSDQLLWVLSNNLKSIETSYAYSNHLFNLWKDDRTTFFEELWYFVKLNTGCQKLSLYFHDLDPEAKAQNSLVVSVLQGTNRAHFDSKSEVGEKLLSEFEGHFSRPLESVEIDNESQRACLTAKVGQGPILIMMEGAKISALQLALMKALFEGLNFCHNN